MIELGREILARADLLRELSDDDRTYSRTYLTQAHRAAARQIATWMAAAGLAVREDNVGNVIGRLGGTDPARPTLLIGSHYDTVYDAGRYDGTVGILLPIAVLDAFRQRKERLPFSIEVVAFAEEENIRFGTAFLGSRAFIDAFDPTWLAHRDDAGHTLREVMLEARLDPLAPTDTRDWQQVAGYVEVHIEQGPTLLNEELPLGVVSSIAGVSRLTAGVRGQSGHAGTVAMVLRKDALAAAAEMILAIETVARANSGQLVATVGTLSLPGAAPNVIPGQVRFTIDVRSGDDAVRLGAVQAMASRMQQIAATRGVALELTPGSATSAVACAPWLARQLSAAVAASGLPVRRLSSGAGHDAIPLSHKTDVAMLFIRSGNGGVSHHPDETISLEDTTLAAGVMTQFLRNFDPQAKTKFSKEPTFLG